MPEKSPTLWVRAIFFAIAITVLGHAIQIHDGASFPTDRSPVVWLTVAIVLAAIAVFLPAELPLKLGWSRRIFECVVALCLIANFYQLASKFPGVYLRIQSFEQFTPFIQGLIVEAVLCGLILASSGLVRWLAFGALIIVLTLLGRWMIVWSPEPVIDVYEFQVGAADAIMEKYDPYDLTFADIYPPEFNYYGEGLVKDGRLQFGYPYLPETILAIMPPRLLQADVRHAHLAALLLSAILIVIINRGLLGFSAAMLFVTTPRFYFVLEQSWIEPFVILTLALTVACIIRWPRLLPIGMGLFLASKQYVPFAALLLFAGSRPPLQTLKTLIFAGIVASVITLPMVFWNFAAFWHSAVSLQFLQPFRNDSMSYLAWMGEAWWPKTAQSIAPFLSILILSALVIWRRRSIGFAAAVALCFLIFFAFSKQAFANYFFFTIGAMACGIAELKPESAELHA